MLATLVVQLLPSLIQAASPLILGLVTHANDNSQKNGPNSPEALTETFAQNLLTSLPGLIAAGADISGLVSHSASLVKAQLAEQRGPTQAERGAQRQRMDDADKAFDKAAAP